MWLIELPGGLHINPRHVSEIERTANGDTKIIMSNGNINSFHMTDEKFKQVAFIIGQHCV